MNKLIAIVAVVMAKLQFQYSNLTGVNGPKLSAIALLGFGQPVQFQIQKDCKKIPDPVPPEFCHPRAEPCYNK